MATPEQFQSDFARVVSTSFSFLTAEFGFAAIQVEPWLVRYRSDALIVDIYRDERSSEAGVIVGLDKATTPESSNMSIGRQVFEDQYSLDEILEYRSPKLDDPGLVGSAFVGSLADANVWLPRLAAALRTYGRDLLTGDAVTYSAMAERRSRAAHKFMAAEKLSAARRAAQVAWQLKDYPAVISALEMIRDQLTPVEHKKLHYALRRTNSR